MDFECGDSKSTVYMMGDEFLSASEVEQCKTSTTIKTYEELTEAVQRHFPCYHKKSLFGKKYIATPVGNMTKKTFKPFTIQTRFDEVKITVAEAQRRLTPSDFYSYMQKEGESHG